MKRVKKWLAGAITGLVLASGMSVEAWHVNGFLTGTKGIVANAEETTVPVGESTVILTYDYLDDGTIEITDCPTSAAGALEIPAEIDGVTVTSIGDNAFSDCDALTTITIPDSVTGIGAWAFAYCDSLTFITIPDSAVGDGDARETGAPIERQTSNTSHTIRYCNRF